MTRITNTFRGTACLNDLHDALHKLQAFDATDVTVVAFGSWDDVEDDDAINASSGCGIEVVSYNRRVCTLSGKHDYDVKPTADSRIDVAASIDWSVK